MNHRPPITEIDFETYYDEECSVKTLGPQAYTRHPDFDAYMVSIVCEDGQEFVGDPRDFDWESIADHWWSSRNKGFDEAVFEWLRREGIVRADLWPTKWIDTAALAAYCGMDRSLAGSIKAAYGISLDKGMREWAKGKTAEDIKAAGKWDAMLNYCLSDSRHDLKFCLDFLPYWPEDEQWLADHTVMAGAYGVAVNAKLLRESMKKLRAVMEKAEQDLPWMVEPPTALLAHEAEDWPRDLVMPNIGKEVVLNLSVAPEDGADCQITLKRRGREKVVSILVSDFNALGFRASYALGSQVSLALYGPQTQNPIPITFTVTSKEEIKPLSKAMLDLWCQKEGITPPKSLSEDDVACAQWEDKYGDQYPWVAAMREYRKANIILKRLETIHRRTDGGVHRFSYSMKYFGAHTGRWSGDGGFNMQNQQRDEAFGVNARNILIAGPGKKLIICDLSQIEPRVLYWCAEDWAMLKRIEEGLGVYAAHAIGTMRWPADKPFTKDTQPILYKTAKARVLGLGYQCGWQKFIDAARILAGLTISAQESKKIVAEYRATNGKVVQLWNKLDHLFKRSVGEDFELTLPSGRVLTYYNVQRKGDRVLAQPVLGKPHFDFYGGKLTENLVQAAARDVFVAGLRRVEDAGHPVIFHSHDEIICEVDKRVPKEEIEHLMTIRPEWLEGCPIGAEAIESDHYLK